MALSVDGRNFSTLKNSITAHCLHRTSTHPSISTSTELEFWTAVVSRLCMVERRYNMTVWSQFYPFFTGLIKNMRGGKTFQLILIHLYILFLIGNFQSSCMNNCLAVLHYNINIHSFIYTPTNAHNRNICYTHNLTLLHVSAINHHLQVNVNTQEYIIILIHQSHMYIVKI